MRRAHPVCRLASLAVLLAAMPLLAATPCTDEPGLASLACRVAALSEAAGTRGPLGDQLAAIATGVERATAACATGKTRRVRARLLALGRRMQEALAIAPDEVLGDLRLTDALRRATASRLEHHPCPE